MASFKAEGLDVELELIFPVDKAYAALRDGAVDFVGGSAHSALAAFPRFKGVKLICAQAQGMYWFLDHARRSATPSAATFPPSKAAASARRLGWIWACAVF